MANDECLTLLEKNIVLQDQDQLSIFDKRVRSISHRAASTGASGAAINEVIDLHTQILRSQVDHIIKTLESLPFEYSNDLVKKIPEICLKYFSSNLGKLSSGIEEIIRVAHGGHIRDKIVAIQREQI
jgi:hypothetical protein